MYCHWGLAFSNCVSSVTRHSVYSFDDRKISEQQINLSESHLFSKAGNAVDHLTIGIGVGVCVVISPISLIGNLVNCDC